MVYGSIYESTCADESFLPDYAMPDGPFRMVSESLETDQNLFDIVIEHDMLEAASAGNVQLESALEAVNEGFAGNMLDSIVKMLTTLKEKIVSIAKSASVKLQAFFLKDNKALVEKYKANFDKCPKDAKVKGFKKLDSNFDAATNFKWLTQQFNDALDAGTAAEASQISKDTSIDIALSSLLLGKESGTSNSSFNKDYKNTVFDKPQEYNYGAISTYITEALTNYGSKSAAINNTKSIVNKEIDSNIARAKDKKKSAKDKDLDATTKELYTAQGNAARSIATVMQKASSKIFSAVLDAIKADMKQSRKAYIYFASKGASGKADPNGYSFEDDWDDWVDDVEESADEIMNGNIDMITEAEIELQDYEVESFFDQYSYDYEELTA